MSMEQTFSEARADGPQFPPAFLKAIDAYHGSAVRAAVEGELGALPWTSLKRIEDWEDWKDTHLYRRMVEIRALDRLV